MADIPSGSLAGAAVSAAALAGIVADLAATLPAAAAVATSVATSCQRIVRFGAPRLRTRADLASLGAELVSDVQALARAVEPGDASAGLYAAAARATGAFPRSASPALTRQYGLARALAASVEVACLGEAFLAEARTAFTDRRAASEARARIAAAYDAAGDRIAATLGQAVLGVLGTAARECSAYLVQRATTLQPVVQVSANRAFPSTLIAWDLYGDPGRADELVLRNRCGTPLFMPATIEAVAPDAT
ncbi:hypothetical protein [Methylobacterium sp. A54F]